MRKDQVFLLACLGVLAGVFGGSFFSLAPWILWMGTALWLALFFSFLRHSLALLFVPIVGFLGGFLITQNALTQWHVGQEKEAPVVAGVARVTNDPEERGFYRETVLRMTECDSDYCPKLKILWRAPLGSGGAPGARLSFACALTRPENFDAAFDYRMFLAKDEIGYLCRAATRAELLPPDMRATLARWFFTPKRAFERALAQSLPQPESGLALGLLIGGDHRLPGELQEAFRRAGLSHIVAISGYNIALIAQGFVILGLGLGLWRRQALWFAAFGIVIFVLLVGAPASAVRAGIMGLAVFAAFFVGRLAISLNILLLAAVVMLMFQPLLLRYDVGFQLSFLASLGIIIGFQFIARLLPREFPAKGLVEIILLTFCVELFVVPLLAYQFGVFAPFALVANALLLPLVPYAMAAAFLTGVAFLVFPGLHFLPAIGAYLFLRLITFTAEAISQWPGASVEVALGGGALVLWYAGLGFAIVRLRRSLLRYGV